MRFDPQDKLGQKDFSTLNNARAFLVLNYFFKSTTSHHGTNLFVYFMQSFHAIFLTRPS